MQPLTLVELVTKYPLTDNLLSALEDNPSLCPTCLLEHDWSFTNGRDSKVDLFCSLDGTDEALTLLPTMGTHQLAQVISYPVVCEWCAKNVSIRTFFVIAEIETRYSGIVSHQTEVRISHYIKLVLSDTNCDKLADKVVSIEHSGNGSFLNRIVSSVNNAKFGKSVLMKALYVHNIIYSLHHNSPDLLDKILDEFDEDESADLMQVVCICLVERLEGGSDVGYIRKTVVMLESRLNVQIKNIDNVRDLDRLLSELFSEEV